MSAGLPLPQGYEYDTCPRICRAPELPLVIVAARDRANLRELWRGQGGHRGRSTHCRMRWLDPCSTGGGGPRDPTYERSINCSSRGCGTSCRFEGLLQSQWSRRRGGKETYREAGGKKKTTQDSRPVRTTGGRGRRKLPAPRPALVREGSPHLQFLRDPPDGAGLTLDGLSREQADPLDWSARALRTLQSSSGANLHLAVVIFPQSYVAFLFPTRARFNGCGAAQPRLRDALTVFLVDARSSGLAQVARMRKRGAGDFEYQRHVASRMTSRHGFPELRSLFESGPPSLDLRMLAAVGYQESAWYDHASSSDGPAGHMMLTESTANAMGVRDRRTAQTRRGARIFRASFCDYSARVGPSPTALAGAAAYMSALAWKHARSLTQMQKIRLDGGCPGISPGSQSAGISRARAFMPRLGARTFCRPVRGVLPWLEWYGNSRGRRCYSAQPVDRAKHIIHRGAVAWTISGHGSFVELELLR